MSSDARQPPVPPPVPVRLLVVDDHEGVRRIVRTIIEAEPLFQILAEADDGPQAVRLALELLPDVVLMDLALPTQNGLEAMAAILVGSATQPAPPKVLVLSLHAEWQMSVEALAAGAAGYLLKDDATRELIAAVLEVAAGGCYLSQRLHEQILRESPARQIPPEILQCLSDTELRALGLLGRGKSHGAIAAVLALDAEAVAELCRQLLDKLSLQSRSETTALALRLGLLNGALPQVCYSAGSSERQGPYWGREA